LKKETIFVSHEKTNPQKKNTNKKHGQSLKTQMIMIEYVG